MLPRKDAHELDTVSNIMTEWVVTVAPTDSLFAARDLMTRNRVSQLAVTDGRDRPIGFISKRSIAQFLLNDTTNRRLENILVSEASSEPIRSIRRDLPIFNAARMFDMENLAYTVVANEHPLAGIVTETDLCHYFSQKWPHKFKVNEFMTRDFIFAKSNYPALHVAQAIVFHQPSVPVIDEELVGILTLSDLLSIDDKTPEQPKGSTALPQRNLALIATKDLMTVNPITADEDTDLAQAAQIIVSKGFRSLPILDEQSNVVGLLSKHDIVKAIGTIGRSLVVEA